MKIIIQLFLTILLAHRKRGDDDTSLSFSYMLFMKTNPYYYTETCNIETCQQSYHRKKP